MGLALAADGEEYEPAGAGAPIKTPVKDAGVAKPATTLLGPVIGKVCVVVVPVRSPVKPKN